MVLRAVLSGVEQRQLHVVGAAATKPFVGGAAGSHSGHGPGSPCAWRAQAPRRRRAWKTPIPACLSC